jgi:hypothetical protein
MHGEPSESEDDWKTKIRDSLSHWEGGGLVGLFLVFALVYYFVG